MASYEKEVVPIVVYNSQTWYLSVQERKTLEVSTEYIFIIRRSDRVRSSLIRGRCGCELRIVKRKSTKCQNTPGIQKEWERGYLL